MRANAGVIATRSPFSKKRSGIATAGQNEMNRSRETVFGVKVDCVDQTTLITEVLNRLRMRVPGYVIPVNLYHLVKLQSDDGSLRSAFAGAAFVLADGRPLLWMARLRGI